MPDEKLPLEDERMADCQYGTLVLEYESWVTPRSAFSGIISLNEAFQYRAAVRIAGILMWEWCKTMDEASKWCKSTVQSFGAIHDRLMEVEGKIEDLEKDSDQSPNTESEIQRAIESHEREYHQDT